MSCIKNCSCLDCEMLEKNVEMLFEKRGFYGERRFEKGWFKCRNYIRYASNVEDLKYSDIDTDWVIL